MQGFIHLLFEGYVSERVGPEHLRQIRQMAGIQGPPLATRFYPDEVTTRLIQAIADYQGVALDDLLHHLGVYFINSPLTHQNYRAFLEAHKTALSLLKQVPTIHHHLETVFKEARMPKLHYVEHTPELLEIIYDSPRRLCRFLRGIVDGVGQYFNEPLEIREMECQQRGAPACRILVRFQVVRRSGPLPEYPSLAQTPGSGPYFADSAPGSRPYHPGSAPASGPYPPETSAQHEDFSGAEARYKRDEEEDLVILRALASKQVTTSRPLKLGNALEPPLDVALSLFELAEWLKANGVSAEYSRLSLIQRSLSRLALQGFVEAKPDPHASGQRASPGAAGLGGQGILAAQRYRITPTGHIWLREKQQRQH